MDTEQLQKDMSTTEVEYEYLIESESETEKKQKIRSLLADNTYHDADDHVVFEERELFQRIIEMVLEKAKEITIIIEPDHIDEFYTDTYYHHYAGLHFKPIKYCKRLSFFQGKITPKFFMSKDAQLRNELQEGLMGTMTIRPLKYGFIGRTLLDPKKVLPSDSGERIYLRTAEFRQHILGVEFTLEAFSFCSQDSCFMTCAEVTIMNLMEYYVARYHAYRKTLPSDIKKLAQRYQHERATPSTGLTYLVVSKILSEFGFSPILYNIETIKMYPLVGDERENEIKRIMHYYVESGIPVAVNVEPGKGDFRGGHSLLCIGHSSEKDERRAKKYSLSGRHAQHAVIDSADFYMRYCVIDDHQKPYEIRNYREISTFQNMGISNLAVPLYKKMYLEAKYAHDIFYGIFRSSSLGLEVWDIPKEYLEEDEMVVMRIYQASSRNYKSFKIESYDDSHMCRKFKLSQLKLPQFVWCCEFFSYSQYTTEERQAFAEIVLDATASLKNDYMGAVIAIETVNKLIKKEKVDSKEKLFVIDFRSVSESDTLIPAYDRNLKKV